MDGSKKLVLALVALVVAGLLFWRPWKSNDEATPDKFEIQAAFICVGCGKEFAESEVTIDLDDAHTGAKCPACGEKKLFRAHVCPKCGHRYVPTFASDPDASREDDKCPKCGTPTLAR